VRSPNPSPWSSDRGLHTIVANQQIPHYA
jgi:hypothetical protein